MLVIVFACSIANLLFKLKKYVLSVRLTALPLAVARWSRAVGRW